TRKADRAPLPAQTSVASEAITAIVGDKWAQYADAVLVIALDKSSTSPQKAMDMLWRVAPDRNIVIVDLDVDVKNLSDVAWRALGNVDWHRDIAIHNGPVDHFAADGGAVGQIGIDATAKTDADSHPRGWPEEIFMSPEIVTLVDNKWSEYGIER
ncbi:MAG: UbiD family decarboxylase, partial [Burkholderiales bacterium]|nr:UbiD family decarboxylase [Anaerolineae bacterium]